MTQVNSLQVGVWPGSPFLCHYLVRETVTYAVWQQVELAYTKSLPDGRRVGIGTILLVSKGEMHTDEMGAWI